MLFLVYGALAQSRAPAVEPQVEVEPQGMVHAPRSLMPAYDFGNIIPASGVTIASEESKMQRNGFLIFLAFASLPFLMWFFMNQSIENSKKSEEDNVAYLKDYRKDTSEEDDHKKAS